MGGMGEAGPNGVAQGAFMVQGFPLDEHVRMILCEPKWKAYQAALRAPQVKGKVRWAYLGGRNYAHVLKHMQLDMLACVPGT